MNTVDAAWIILKKDLTTEFRSKEILLTMGFFGFLVVLISSFAFFRGDAPIGAVASGTLWISIAFSGTLGLQRSFERERESDAIRALLLAPISRGAIYLAKMAGIVSFMTIIEFVVVPAVMLFFNLDASVERLSRLGLAIVLGNIGYAIVGTVLAAALLRAQRRDVLLAVVLYPVIIPVVVAGVKASAAVFEPSIDTGAYLSWIRILLTFDVVFLVASLWIFEPMLLE